MQIFQFGQKKKTFGSTRKLFGMGWKRLLLTLGGTAAFVLLVTLVAFWGRPPHTPIIFKGMQISYRFEAPFTFEYESEVRRNEKRAEARANVEPVYVPDMAGIDVALEKCARASGIIEEHFDELAEKDARTERVDAILAIFDEARITSLDPDLHGARKRMAMDISQLIDVCGTRELYKRISDRSLELFREQASGGIVADGDEKLRRGGWPTISAFREKFRSDFDVALWEITGFSSARRAPVLENVVDLLSPMIRGNVRFDNEETRALIEEAEAAVAPVKVVIREGDPILQPGTRVDDEVFERWNAYRFAQREHEGKNFGLSIFFCTNLLYVFCVVVIAGIYRILLVPSDNVRMRRRFLFSGAISVINILLIRVILELAESETVVRSFGSAGDALVWLSSPAVVAISVSAIAGAPLGVLSSLFVGAVAALMLGGNIQILMMVSVAALIAVWVARGAMKRATLVRAGFYSGLAMAVTAVCIGFYSGTHLGQVALNTVSAILIGLGYGIVSAGLLSILEGVFRARTNITFIELADFNHPLLRKLQFVAPGTFHHSVMVANYAEQAAHEVGANTALCRCAALFHDIGKTFKPEYFTENQTNGINPHNEARITPQMSALIIKSHVRDGSELAVEYHLPERIRDVIEQHHGTSTVGYFLEKAKKIAEEAGEDPSTVDESAFRYEGPKPQTLEAAIVMMCDVVEASSRSLKKITPQAVEELVVNLIRKRVQDGEFDECPITLSQISAIRRSLVASVLTTFHSRVEYPKEAGGFVPEEPSPEKRTKVRIVRKEL